MKRTDREVFHSLALGDPWHDAELVEVWSFLYNHEKTTVPDSWCDEMAAFNGELLAQVPPPELVKEYNDLIMG